MDGYVMKQDGLITKVDSIHEKGQEENDLDGQIVSYIKSKSVAVLQIELEQKLNSSAEDVSKALRRLKKVKLIDSIKKGSFNYYKIV